MTATFKIAQAVRTCRNLEGLEQTPPLASRTSVWPSSNFPQPDLSLLRIALISGNYNCLRDGANRAQNQLVSYLVARGAAVRIYSPTCKEPAFPPTGDLVSIPSLPMPFGRNEYRASLRLPRTIRYDIEIFKPNIFHISLPLLHGRSALKLARKMGIPVVASMHTRFETYPRYYRLGFMEPIVLALLRRFYRACDKVVAPCESVARTMENQGMAESIGVWSRGVDQSIFTPKRRDNEWRRANGFGDGEVVIAYLGRIVLEKGLDQFAETIKQLRSTGARFRVLVIGDGPARDWFAGQLGTASFVGFLHGTALARALASADILLNPSATEGFGNVSLEAMSCGLPVVAADATGNDNIVVDGVTGALVKPDNTAGYVAAIRQYLDDPTTRLMHGCNARQRSTQFTWDNANAAMAETYFQALRC